MANPPAASRLLIYATILFFLAIYLGSPPKPLQDTGIYSLGAAWITWSSCALAAGREIAGTPPSLCTPLGSVLGTAVGAAHMQTTYDDKSWAVVRGWVKETVPGMS